MTITRKITLASAVVVAAVITAANVPPRIAWSSIRAVERTADTAFQTMMTEDPWSVLGYTRGVYLDGYGVVFSAEVELVPSGAPSPFRPAFTKDDIVRQREKKRVRISFLKEQMPGMLVNLAHTLRDMQPGDKVALAVTIPYYRWERADGLPRQIVMSASREALVMRKGTQLSKSIRTEEFF